MICTFQILVHSASVAVLGGSKGARVSGLAFHVGKKAQLNKENAKYAIENKFGKQFQGVPPLAPQSLKGPLS